MPDNKILVVEDDKTTADFIVRGLSEEGFTVDHVSDGRDGLFHATDGSYGAIVLDRMLPGMDGMAMLAALRAADVKTPVLILSALGSAEDRVAGLTKGSDDYLVKPFVFAELLARLKLLIRRGSQDSAEETRLTCGDLSIELLKREVRRGDRLIELQPREYRLLEFMMRQAGQVITRTMLLEGVWDYHFDPGTNVIDVHISRLRKKIDSDGEEPLIHTVRGAGYRLGD
ncbi:response regulator transcription factor [Aurantiacibacter rhizosphaerae]|uniref:Response regulator n=1 Tax=Aurantiacibacter rhizosphaerae TaxID=2691582 RepID=A0A844XI75_9SPHN|nr:response regulator transcription factor [Aurantiacibacter rhizosphaerae]MWV29248.1 response regulator [Aurantiacibacter rhizosphaerae]